MPSAPAMRKKPFLYMLMLSPLSTVSLPKIEASSILRTRATGTAARALRPMSPSPSRSTKAPAAKAMSIAHTVGRVAGRQKIMVGSRVSTSRGLIYK